MIVAWCAQAGHWCGSTDDVHNNNALGGIRISFGYMSSMADVEAFMAFVEETFVRDAASMRQQAELPPPPPPSSRDSLRLRSIHLYPVKSCAAQTVDAWPLGPYGLLYDREWSIVDTAGRVLNQKELARLALIVPRVDETTGALTLAAPGVDPISVDDVGGTKGGGRAADGGDSGSGSGSGARTVIVCGQTCTAVAATHSGERNSAVDEWLFAFLGRRCSLLRKDRGHVRLAGYRPELHGRRQRPRTGDKDSPAGDHGGAASASARDTRGGRIGFANEGQFLLVGEASVAELQSRVAQRHAAKVAAGRGNGEGPVVVRPAFFRPNFVFEGGTAFEEDTWQQFTVGGIPFTVS